MAKTKQPILIACLKMMNIGFIFKMHLSSGIGERGGYLVLVNYQSILSSIDQLFPNPNYLSV